MIRCTNFLTRRTHTTSSSPQSSSAQPPCGANAPQRRYLTDRTGQSCNGGWRWTRHLARKAPTLATNPLWGETRSSAATVLIGDCLRDKLNEEKRNKPRTKSKGPTETPGTRGFQTKGMWVPSGCRSCVQYICDVCATCHLCLFCFTI